MVRMVLSGNHAQSYGALRSRVEVVAAYPITPQTAIVEKLADLVASGELPAQFLQMESEHSALQTCLSASALGARAYTATSSQGLLLMHELLHWAAGMRAPLVMGVVNRAVAPPWSIGVDHTDTVAQRDTGWIQFYAESNQEVLDTVLEAYRVAEDVSVRLPAMVMEDAFYLSHTVEPVDVPTPAEADAFLPPRPRRAVLVPGVAGRLGSFAGPADYVRFRRELARAMRAVPAVLEEAEEEYRRTVGRSHGGALSAYRAEDADAILLTMGTAATTARTVVDELRSEGKKVGTARLRLFRPFPTERIRELGALADRLGVLDRSYTFGESGAAASEVGAALYGSSHRPSLASFLAGIGGRDITPNEVRRMFGHLLSGSVPETRWIDLEEEGEAVG